MVLTPFYSDHLCFQFSRESLPPLDPSISDTPADNPTRPRKKRPPA
jgi:hypothetical protein